MKGDINLPNESGRVDPRIATAQYEARKRRTTTPPTPTRAGGVRAAVTRARESWRSFTSVGKR